MNTALGSEKNKISLQGLDTPNREIWKYLTIHGLKNRKEAKKLTWVDR